MSDVVDYTEVPYLQEILNFLPINPDDEEDVINYIQNITNLVAVNYKYGQYQFAYFGIHLLYMTYIYCTAWKISQIEPERYKDAIVFARAYLDSRRVFVAGRRGNSSGFDYAREHVIFNRAVFVVTAGETSARKIFKRHGNSFQEAST